MDTDKQPIFIHIPKTGGTSINCVMKGTEWQTPLNYHYRHLDPDTKISNAGDIFDSKINIQYQDEYLFMMLRNPIDRLISEYYYIRKNIIFMDMLSPPANNFLEYVSNHQTANGMLKFLLGKRIYSSDIISDANSAIDTIEALDIHVGIFEQYDRSLSYFKHTGNFTWPETISVKRATLNRPKVQQISSQEMKVIKDNNKADFALYEYAKARLLKKTNGIAVEKIKYKGGKLDFVIPYTLWNCILDIELNNRQFILENKKFFVTLNVYLHKTVTTGKDYTKCWVKMFKKAVNDYFKGTKFAKEIKKIKRTCIVDEVIAIARLIDRASSDKLMGLDLGNPKIKLALTDEMSKVFTQDDTISKGNIKW
jgi:hypothetical protein